MEYFNTLPNQTRNHLLELADTVQGIVPISNKTFYISTTQLHTDKKHSTLLNEIVEWAQKGQRHSTLVRIIGILLNAHFTEEETLAEVLAWNLTNNPPMSQHEVITTVRDCYERWDRYVPPAKSKDIDDKGY